MTSPGNGYDFRIPQTMKTIARLLALTLIVVACSAEETVTPNLTDATPGPTTTVAPTTTESTIPEGRQCVDVTGGVNNVSTGDAATDALFLSGELFVCADEVVIADPADLNSLAAGAQLAAAYGGPLLLPHPQLAAEIGRLKPLHVHIIGDADPQLPPESDVTRHSILDAVEQARSVLGVTAETRLPAIPDSSTIVETVAAISAGDHVVLPQVAPGETVAPPQPEFTPAEIVAGLAVPGTAERIWLVDAADPVTTLVAAGTGGAVQAQVVAIDATNILGFPEVGTALAGRDPSTFRFVGAVPETDTWELSVLLNGRQLPGGGFSILGDDRPKRYVAFYGHPNGSALGVLGEQGPQETLDRMAPFLEQYEADGYQAIPTFEMMASVAAADITDDGDYSFEWPVSTFTPWVDLAAAQGAYVVLDLQTGRDDFLSQAKMYEELLLQPHVGLALDPEWRLKPDQTHLRQVGRVDAAEVNLVVDWLADLVRDNGLPQKMIIIHQFREFMIENRASLKQRPELQMVLQMDGQGPIPTKDTTWGALTSGWEEHPWKWGWKNFFDEDSPTPTPEHAMGKVPTPVFVSYQ
jgi:hypothetical protein